MVVVRILGAFVLMPLWIYKNYIQLISITPTSPIKDKAVIIVFGAAVLNQNIPSHALNERLLTAKTVWDNNKSSTILVTGDNGTLHYNEPTVMRNKLIEMGVPKDKVIADFAGFRTYDSCIRAKQIFNVKSAVLISQGYHLPRALFTCNTVGVKSYGVKTEGIYSEYHSTYYEIREIAALYVSVIDLYIRRPRVILGNPEPINN